MTDLDPEIWKNPTLGAVGAGPFLPELEAQAIEDRHARLEGRTADTVEYVNRYPKFMEPNSVPTVMADPLNYIKAEEPPSEEIDIDKLLGD
jgi:hypothetical protein